MTQEDEEEEEEEDNEMGRFRIVGLEEERMLVTEMMKLAKTTPYVAPQVYF